MEKGKSFQSINHFQQFRTHDKANSMHTNEFKREANNNKNPASPEIHNPIRTNKIQLKQAIISFTWESAGFAVPENILILLWLFLFTAFSNRFDCKNFGNTWSLITGTQGFPFTGSVSSHFYNQTGRNVYTSQSKQLQIFKICKRKLNVCSIPKYAFLR